MSVTPPDTVTILTKLPVWSVDWLRPRARERARLLRYWLTQLGRRAAREERQSGPLTVERNLLAGLGRIGEPYRLNPPVWAITSSVGVLRSAAALRWAIAGKNRGCIQRLVAGPNLVITPREDGGILTAPEIDWILTPSAWVSRMYESICPALTGRIVEWAVGVDQDFWHPVEQKASEEARDFLIYRKLQPDNMSVVEGVIEELQRRNLSYEVVPYGGYAPSEYRSLLQASRAMVFLSESETQGLALFEAWACDVPSLVWDRGRWQHPAGTHEWTGASSAPYLTAACGLAFKDADDLPRKLDAFLNCCDSYAPREFILAGYTLAHSASNYLKLFAHKGPQEQGR